MIVGRKDIDFTKLKLACRSEDSLLRFTIDLVPTPLRHIREVVGQPEVPGCTARAVAAIAAMAEEEGLV